MIDGWPLRRAPCGEGCLLQELNPNKYISGYFLGLLTNAPHKSGLSNREKLITGLKNTWSYKRALTADYGFSWGGNKKLRKMQLLSADESLYITPWNCAKQFQSWEGSKYIIYKKFIILACFIYLRLWFWNTVYILDTWRWHGHFSASACCVKKP